MAFESFVAFDLETTGSDPAADAIIEIGAVRFERGEAVATFSQLVDPGRPIPLRITNLTGISDTMARGKPGPGAALAAFLAFAGDLPLVAYNAAFDMAFLRGAARRDGTPVLNPCFDCHALARLAAPLAKSHRLGSLARYVGHQLEHAHRAEDDARACGAVFVALLRVVDGMELGAVQAILALAEPTDFSLRPVFAAAEAELLRRGARGGLSFIKPASGPLHDAAAEAETLEGAGLDAAALVSALEPGGLIAEAFPSYELRPQQLAMCQAVAEAISGGHHLMVEAGTGTGKSLAYLLPAVEWARQTGERVVISTGTINLQEQLTEKDIPFLQTALGEPVTAALAKGRSNYICLRKWEESLAAAGFFMSDAEREQQMRVVAWLAQTQTGDRAELGLAGAAGDELWRQVMSESETCLGPKCKWYKQHCFAFRAKRRAREAEILVVNHALLLADLKSDNQVLPPFKHLIIDEAHHLESVATENLGITVDQSEVGAALAYLFRGYRGEAGPGLLPQLKRRLRQPLPARPPVGVASEDLLDRLIDLVQTTRTEFDALCRMLVQFVESRGAGEDGSGEGRTVRLKETTCTGPLWEALAATGSNASGRLLRLHSGLGTLAEALEDLESAPLDRDAILVDIQKYAQICFRFGQDIEAVLRPPEADSVHWVEAVGRDRQRALLRSAPVDVGPQLKELLWDRLRSVVLTSATLTVNDTFEHELRRLGLAGLPPDRVRTLTVPSPFVYRRQALLCVPDDVPNPRTASDLEYTRAVTDFLRQFLVAVEGRTLVLFTSHRQLQQVYQSLKDDLAAAGLVLLAQGIDGARSRLIEEFKESPRAVLFGSQSFWEGVDIPGEGLSCVVMVKLPFAPPDHPVMEARIEDLERRGLSSFFALSLPQAVIRFKQGFGRLVRTKKDRGVVVVFDNRVHHRQTRYGAQFLRSLPGPALLSGPREAIVERAVQWLAEEMTFEYE